MLRRRFALFTVAALAIALLVSLGGGCAERMTADSERRVPRPGDEPTAPAVPGMTPSSNEREPAAPGAERVAVRIFLVREETVGAASRMIPKTTLVARAAMRELLAGPTAQEQTWGLGTAIPVGTHLNGVTINDGLATVDLSPEFETGGGSLSMQLRAAQVVFTLTQFGSVDRVAFQIDGEPLLALGGEGLIVDPPTGRAEYPNVTPLILVEGPTPGDAVSSPVRVWGSSNTFEGTVQLRVIGPAGETLEQRHFQSQGGMGIWGPFETTFTYPASISGDGEIVLYEESARDGSEVNVVRFPVRFE